MEVSARHTETTDGRLTIGAFVLMWWSRQASELRYRRVGTEGHGAEAESLEVPRSQSTVARTPEEVEEGRGHQPVLIAEPPPLRLAQLREHQLLCVRHLRGHHQPLPAHPRQRCVARDQPLRGHVPAQRLQRLTAPAAALRHLQCPALIWIHHGRHVPVARQPPAHRPLHHPADGHAVLGALDPRHSADQERLEPPGVQLPALPLPGVVVPARTTALGTGRLRSETPPHKHPQFLAVSIHVQLLDHPVRPEIEHGSQVRSSRPRIRTATADSLPRSWGRAYSRAN